MTTIDVQVHSRWIGKYLRQSDRGWWHWCPGCRRPHHVVTNPTLAWKFNGIVDFPTFSPSVKISYSGSDAGVRYADEYAPQRCCHYHLVDGNLTFLTDSSHALSGETVPLPELPDEVKSDEWPYG